MKYPDISVSFNMLHVMEHARKEKLGPYEPYLIDDAKGDAKFDIETYFTEFQDGIDIRWMYAGKQYKGGVVGLAIQFFIAAIGFFLLADIASFLVPVSGIQFGYTIHVILKICAMTCLALGGIKLLLK